MSQKWKRLDLRSKIGAPRVEALVALRMEPNNSDARFRNSIRYDIGWFKRDGDGKKLWWHGACSGVNDPARLRQHYNIWWCPIAEFDGV